MKKSLSILLSLCVVFFCIDAVISLVDDTLIVGWGINALPVLRGLLSLAVVGMALVIYLLMGITPMIPKRIFLPLVLFNLVAALAVIPLSIYHFGQLQQVAWAVSWAQVIVGFSILLWVQRGWKFRWPAVPEDRLGDRPFSWLNLSGFIVVNLVVLLPAILVYLAVCASLAIDHLSGGFLALRKEALTVRARKYARADGRTIDLIPMMHVGEAGFYRKISESFPTNSVVLLEGVTDRRKLLKQGLNYDRMASSLGLVEQREEFGPGQGKPRRADIDIEEFSPETIAFLNVAGRLHSEGFTLGTFRELTLHSQEPAQLQRLWADLLTKRNAHLMEQIKSTIEEGDDVVVPWGAAHMPGIARQIEQAGFSAVQSTEFPVIRFRR